MLLHTPPCESGWKAIDFVLKDGSGHSFSLEELKGDNGTVVAFISNHCPFVVEIAELLSSEAKALKKMGVAVVAIMPNNYQYVQLDSPENMILFSEKYGFEFPYLVDETQEIAKAFGAVCTPDFFGFNAQLELQYRGRIDEGELTAAMATVAKTNSGPVEQRPSKGCSIKWR